MRLWSLHPSYLDSRGLVALWREGLLARAVLLGKTKGYQHHSQLKRFQKSPNPVEALDCYLSLVFDEACARGYHFDKSKIEYRKCQHGHSQVTSKQLQYEWEHLLQKLKKRNKEQWRKLLHLQPHPHDCFHVVKGPVAEWERLPNQS